MKLEYYYLIIAILFSTNIGAWIFMYADRKKSKERFFKMGLTHAYKHLENKLKLGEIQHRKLLVLFNDMKREALKEHGD